MQTRWIAVLIMLGLDGVVPEIRRRYLHFAKQK